MQELSVYAASHEGSPDATLETLRFQLDSLQAPAGFVEDLLEWCSYNW